MYRMLYNDSFLFDPFDETRIVSSASITTNVNAASYLDFTIAANHPLYNVIEHQSGTVTLYSDKEKLFQGLITDISIDMDGNKSVTCASALNWLKDVQLRPYSTDQDECNEYEFKLDKAPDSLDAYFQWLIDQYNAQNRDGRRFVINVNQANDLTRENTVYFSSTSPQSVADALEQNILNNYGGYLVLRYEDDELILDLYSDIHEMNEQIIDYGENILDITRDENTEDQYTAVYPLGKTPQYTAEQQKYHDEKDAYDARMKQRDEAEKAAIDKLKKEEDAEQNRINGITDKNAKKAAQDALKRRKDQRQAREKAFSNETKRLQDEQKVKDDKNSADKTKPNPITIESLNDGGYEGDLDIFKEGDVVFSMSYVQRYGYKEYVYSESDIEDKKVLLKLAVAKLKTLMAPSLTIDVRAVDQALYNPKHRHLFAGQAVRVRSKIQNVDEFMMVSSIDLDLIDPSRTTATLGVAYDTLTGQQSSFLRNLNSQIVASVDAVDKLGEDVKVTEITLGRVETVVDNVKADNELIVNTVGDYKWMTDTAWGKAEDAQESADEANQGVADTNVRIDNIKMETDERIDDMETDISGIHDGINDAKAEIVTIKENAEQIRQDAQAGIDEAKQQAEDIRTEANTAINNVRTDLAETEAKAEQARQNASSALGGLSSAQAQINGLRIDVNRHQENITNIDGEIVGVKDTISGVSETANSALTVATTNTQAINEQSTRIDTAYADIESARTSISEVKQTADGLKVNLETNYLDKTEIGKAYASKAELSATSESITSTVEKTYATKAALEGLQNIADAAIETWSGQTVPTASNAPASTWTTDALKRQHSGDIYYDMTTGKSYRWGSEDGKVYSWSMIADSDITKAIADAAKAQQTANGAKQDVVNLSNDIKATYTTKSEFKQTSDEIKGSVSEVASANEANAQKIAEVSVKADGIGAKVEEQAETINGHTTTIGQLGMKADGLQTKFEQVSDNLTELTDNLDGLINPSFSTNSMYGWTIRPTDKVRMSTCDKQPGGPYLVVDAGNAIFLATIINDSMLTFAPKHRYRVTLMIKVTNTSYFSNDVGVAIRLAKPNYANMSDWVDGFYANVPKSEIGTEWQSYSKDIVVGEYGATGHLRLAFQPAANANAYFAIKSVKIEDITEAQTALVKTSELQQNLDGFRQTVSETYTTKTETEDAINAMQIGGTNLSIANGYYNVSGLTNFTYTPADDQYDFDVSAAASSVLGHQMAPKTRCADQRLYPWGKWGTCTFDIYAERECTFVTDINNGLADGSVGGNDHDLRSEAQMILPDGSMQPIGGNASTATHITIPAQQWVRIGIVCYNGNQSANPNHADIQDYSSIGFLSLGEDFHVKVRKIKFEVGNKPTAWSPCPLDMLDTATAATTYTTKTEFNQTKNAITARVEENAESIAGHTASIGQLQVKSNEISSKVDGVTETANTARTQSTTAIQNLNGFKQTVEQEYIKTEDANQAITDAIDDISVGGTNMLLDTQLFGQDNPNNIADQRGRLTSYGTMTMLGNDKLDQSKFNGSFRWRQLPASVSSNNPDGATYQVTIEPGKSYTFSFDALGTAEFWVCFYGPSGYIECAKTICTTGVPGNDGKAGDGNVLFSAPGSKWVHHEITWTLKDSTNPNGVKYILFRRKGTTGYFSILAPKLELGTKATGWSPSPFDSLRGADIKSTYSTKSEVSQTESRITQTVEATYATKTQLSDEMKQSLKTTELRGRMDGNYWFKLGRLTMEQRGRDFHIDYTGGRGYNGATYQNSQLEIHVRSSNGSGTLFGVTVNRLLNADMYQVKAFAIDATHIDLYIKSDHQFSTGTMAYYGQYSDFSGAKRIDDISTAEGTELTVFEQSLSSKTYVDQTANSVAIGVVEDYKNGKHGDKLTTSADITVLKEEINQTVQKNYADISEKIELKGSENVVQNPSFEVADFAGWEKHDNWYYNTTTGGRTGQNYVVEPINPNADGDELINAGSIKVEFGHTYRVSFWAKSDLADGVYAYLRYQRKINGAWETSRYSLTADMITVGRDWKQITFNIEPEQKASEIRVQIIGRNNTSGVAFFAVDDVSLTDYSVAKTINTTMSQIDQKADSISQTVTNNYTSLNAAIGAVGKRITGLENPNFDAIEEGSDRLTGWTANGPWTRANLSGYSPVQAGSGTYFTGATSGVADQTISLINDGYITTYPGMKLQISLWAWIDDNVINNNAISIGVVQQNNTVTRELVTAETNSWKQYSATVTIPNNVDRVRVCIGFTTTARSAAIRLDSVSVADVTTANVALGKATTAVQDLEGFRQTVSNTYATKDAVNSMQSEWSQTASGFEASIKKSEQAISAVGSGVSIINPGFESGDMTGWKSSGFASTSVANGAIYSNTTYRFTGVTGSSMGVLENDGRVSAKVGDYIKVTARILALNNNVVVNCPCRIGFRSPNGVPYFKSMNILNTGWNTIESTVQVTMEGLHGFYLDFQGASANLKVLVDDVTMENDTTAVALRTDLETRIAMTSNGVRVGKVVNGAFEGTSALLNSEGSFDILQGEEAVATLRSDYVGLMRNSDTNTYRFGVRPYKEHSTGSVDYTYEGVDLQTVGGFSLNGIPAAPASDILAIRPAQMTGNNYFIKYNVDTLKNDNVIFINAATLHREYYQRLDEGKPALAVHFKHAVGMTTTKDNDTNVSNDHIDTQVMALNPCLYGIQFVLNAQKNTVNTYLDATVKVMKTGESTWINSSALPAFRAIEQGDPIGWLTRTSPMYFVKLDVGYRFGIYISGSSNDFKIGSLNKLIITRMPFSGGRMD